MLPVSAKAVGIKLNSRRDSCVLYGLDAIRSVLLILLTLYTIKLAVSIVLVIFPSFRFIMVARFATARAKDHYVL